ncbi:PilZ domain-containing protein [uncultured Desulfosarcina sp.]|uniref:flagellar brake protein n=1 Tax=uncultured Desulfosarcina sp. TaxID=218289 RepID=UPI0029C90DDD|nr:PilZ domain-containing protein [uncultured Desulfosarcina sp.]
MGDAGKVQGEKLSELFNTLVAKKVIISMNVVGAGFDRLTCITGITKDSDGSHLLVDPPDDFEEAAAVKDLWHLRFNFNGPDRLEYIFSTRGGRLCEQGLKIPFPEHVERLQRRRNFRVNTLIGTQMHFKLKKIQGVIDLINVSLGGVYGVLTKHNFKFMRGPVLKMDQQVYDVSLVFPGDHDRPGNTIYVKKAEVKRIEHDQDRGFYRYAFEFEDIEKEEQNKLTQVIYDLQRWYLQRRK